MKEDIEKIVGQQPHPEDHFGDHIEGPMLDKEQLDALAKRIFRQDPVDEVEPNQPNAATSRPHTDGTFLAYVAPETTEFDTGAVRQNDVGRGFFSMIPPCALRAMAKRFEDGARKYSDNNWMKGIPLSRYYDALMRHALAALEGKDDEDHMGAILWNAAAWLWTEEQIKLGKLPKELDNLGYRQ